MSGLPEQAAKRRSLLLAGALLACGSGGAVGKGGAGPAAEVPPGRHESFDLQDLPKGAVDPARFPKAPAVPYRPKTGGRAWFVAPGGTGDGDSLASPAGDVRKTVEQAGDGDVVWLKGGAYKVGVADDEFALRVHKSVVVSAWPGQRAVLEPLDDGPTYGIDLEGDGAVLDGLELKGFSQAGIYFGRIKKPQKGAVIARVKVEGGTDGIRSQVRAGRGKNPLVEGLLLYDVQVRGAAIGFNCGEGPCNDVRLERVLVDGGEEDARGEGHSGADAIAFEAGDNIAIVDSTVRAVGADGFDLKARRVLLHGAQVRGVGRNGIKLWYGGDLVNCLVYGTGADAAIVFDHGASYRITHTTVARHGHRGESYSLTMAYDHPRQPGRLEISNSIFWDNGGPLWVAGATELVITNSLFSRSKGGTEIVWARSPDVTIARYEDAQKKLPGSRGILIGSDPRFVDPDQGDFRLQPTSPAVDRGSNLEQLPLHDLSGKPRKIGERPDLGPYELAPAKEE